MCFQEMTIPGNVLPKIFSVPWDKAPPPRLRPRRVSVCLSVCLSVCFCVSVSVCVHSAFKHSSSYMKTVSFTVIFVCLCLSVCPCVCLYVCLCVCLYVSMYVSVSVCICSAFKRWSSYMKTVSFTVILRVIIFCLAWTAASNSVSSLLTY